LLSHFLIDQSAKESRDEITANKHHIEIEDNIEEISNIASTPDLNEDLIDSILEVIVEV
jgi:hypothetical protein